MRWACVVLVAICCYLGPGCGGRDCAPSLPDPVPRVLVDFASLPRQEGGFVGPPITAGGRGQETLLVIDRRSTVLTLSASAPTATARTLLSTKEGQHGFEHDYEDAVCGPGKLCWVESQYEGEWLRYLGPDGNGGVICSVLRQDRDRGPRHIHSLSLSPSGELLAFMVSGGNQLGNWRGHTLYVYDFASASTKGIWSGNIDGPSNMMNPYSFVQPLPWTDDGKKLFLSTLRGRILSITVESGEAEDLCGGSLPIGVKGGSLLLVTRGERLRKGDARVWHIESLELDTKTVSAVADIVGPVELRAPLLSPDRSYVSCVVRAYPDGQPKLGFDFFTLFIDLESKKLSVLNFPVFSWSAEQPF